MFIWLLITPCHFSLFTLMDARHMAVFLGLHMIARRFSNCAVKPYGKRFFKAKTRGPKLTLIVSIITPKPLKRLGQRSWTSLLLLLRWWIDLRRILQIYVNVTFYEGPQSTGISKTSGSSPRSGNYQAHSISHDQTSIQGHVNHQAVNHESLCYCLARFVYLFLINVFQSLIRIFFI